MTGDLLPESARPLDEHLLAAYAGTEVVDRHGAVWSGQGATALPGPTWVVTAENPFSVLQDPEVNAAAMAELERALCDAGLDPVPLVGRAPDGSWSEACFGVETGPGDVIRAWGREHGQHAVFLLTATEHQVVSCWTGELLATRPRSW